MRDHRRAILSTMSPERSKTPPITAATDNVSVTKKKTMADRRGRILGLRGTCYRPRVDFRKTYYILPNLFTLSSVFCGFVSISLSASGQGGVDLYQAAVAICFGFFFDTADGRVARLTKTQTDLGRDLDSLADLVTFGVAPGLLVYKWGLTNFGRWGMFVAGLYVCAGALRLARFNVLSRREEAAQGGVPKAPGKYTLGLTIPAAASVLVLMVIVAHNVGVYAWVTDGFVAVVVLLLSYLMVSRVRFRSFKDLRLTKRTLGLVALVVGSGIVVALAGVDKAVVFLFLISAYIVPGSTETMILMKRHFSERRQLRHAQSAAAAAAVTTAPSASRAHDDEPTPADDDVLRELGAFDEPEPHGHS